MRNLLLTLASFCLLTVIQAQQDDRSYFGVKAGVNLAQIRSGSSFTDDDLLNTKTGLAGGLFYHLSLNKVVALQPELLYSQMGSKFDANTSDRLSTPGQVNLNYISVPVLIKISPFRALGLFAGPQLDYYMGGKATFDDSDISDIGLSYGSAGGNQATMSLTGGLELAIAGTFGIYGRYIYGLTDITDGDIEDIFTQGSKLYNDAIQVGLTIGFPGKEKMDEAVETTAAPLLDTDGDGTPDVNDACPLVAGSPKYDGCPIPDSDGDGINDEVDKCPSIFGTAKYQGCPVPDTDGDGFNDEVDMCPTEPGILKYNGCPVPDTDGDGINDDEDRCPTQRGLAAYGGCPVPDSDGDGINDDTDKCVNYPGKAENGGCPDMTLYFANDDPKLTAIDIARLEYAMEVIQANPKANLILEGYASPVGSADHNMKLSQKRADNVKNYFISKGVAAERITAVGKGMDNPITAGNKEDSNTLSRRVYIRVATQ